MLKEIGFKILIKREIKKLLTKTKNRTKIYMITRS